MLLAVDTSCYTTSMCVIDVVSGKIVTELNKNLKVKPGERGLRQSDGFFQHVNQLTEIYQWISDQIDPLKIQAVSVSTQPRPIENSYMPVFHAGLLFCKNLANTLKVPLFTTSHQEGHLMAALKTSEVSQIPETFIGMHLSGGTTELLNVCALRTGFDIEIIGGTLDLNFGQLIDRIGVMMGLSFPCGKEMDQMAQTVSHDEYFKVKINNSLSFNLSGLENQYAKLVGTMPEAVICRHVFNTIAYVLEQIMMQLNPDKPVVLSGGVASNSIVKQALKKRLKHRSLYFAMPEYSRDNAYGVAEIGRLKFIEVTQHA